MPCGICYSQHAPLATCLSHTSAVNPPKVLRYEGQHFLCWTNACPPKVKRLQMCMIFSVECIFCHFVGWVWWCLNGHMVQQFLCPANWQRTYSPTPNLGIHDVIMGDTCLKNVLSGMWKYGHGRLENVISFSGHGIQALACWSATSSVRI